ncbi:hypothetical protein Aperf_G00000028254 [Anoplocephala perfoliata]
MAPMLYGHPGNTNGMLGNYSNAQYDSGIDSLNSKGTPTVDQNDSLSSRKWIEQTSTESSRSVDESVTCAIKTFLYSDAALPVGKSEHFEVKDCNSFVKYVEHLLSVLGKCISAIKYFARNDPIYEQLQQRHVALRWKSETIHTLLQEYEELLKKTGGHGLQASRRLTSNPSRKWPSLLQIWDPARNYKKAAPVPLTTSFVSERARMREIENQIADLSGSIHLKLSDTLLGGNSATVASSYKIRLKVVNSSSVSGSLLNLYQSSEVVSRPTTIASNSSPHEWNFTVSRKQYMSSSYLFNDPNNLINAQLQSQLWKFSSNEGTLLMEPCATLVADVSVDKKRLRKTFDLMQFLTVEPQRITLELTVMSTPCVELEVRWIPFTRLDLSALERFPVSQTLAIDWSDKFSIEESSHDSSNVPIMRDRRRRDYSSNKAERDQDTMNWIGNSPSEISISQQQSLKMSDSYMEDIGNQRDGAGGNIRLDESDIASLIKSTQNGIEALNRQPHRYMKLLDDLLVVIRGLHEQLNSFEKSKTRPLSKAKLPPTPVFNDLEKSLSLLDIAIDESQSKLTSSEKSLSSGWDDLDSVIKWHLRNVSLLLRQLASSERIYINLPERNIEKTSTMDMLCVREDLIAMALDSQSEILSDITGLVLSYSESKEFIRVTLQSHCLAYCGISDRGCQGTQTTGQPPLFAMSFWTNLVWQNAPPGFLSSYSSPYPGYFKRLSCCGDNFQPSLMVERESLQTYLLKEYSTVFSKEENDEQIIETAIDKLIEQITDIDLTDASPSREIPLTQLCLRLKPQNFKMLAKFYSSYKLGSFSNRTANTLLRSTQPTDPSITLTLEYLIKQEKLQRELRESDEESLFRSLEILVDGLVSSDETRDRHNDLMNISVSNFICLALALQHEDDSVKTYAGRAICDLEESTSLAYDKILESNQLPFLRTCGPCCTFLKSLSDFNQKMISVANYGQTGVGYSIYIRRSTPSPTDGYSLISPIGSAILGYMQYYDLEEYRLAALAAWECISAPEASVGRSATSEGRGVRKGGSRWLRREDKGPIQEEVKRMNLSDDSANVRRLALRILQAQKKFRSTACCLDISS